MDRINPFEHSLSDVLTFIAHHGKLHRYTFKCIGVIGREGDSEKNDQNSTENSSTCDRILNRKKKKIVTAAQEIQSLVDKAGRPLEAALRKSIDHLIDLLHCPLRKGSNPTCYSYESKRALYSKWAGPILAMGRASEIAFSPTTPVRTKSLGALPSTDSGYASGPRLRSRSTRNIRAADESPTRRDTRSSKPGPECGRTPLSIKDSSTENNKSGPPASLGLVDETAIPQGPESIKGVRYVSRLKKDATDAHIGSKLNSYLRQTLDRPPGIRPPRQVYVFYEEKTGLHKIGCSGVAPGRVKALNIEKCICVKHNTKFDPACDKKIQYAQQVETVVQKAFAAFRYELFSLETCPVEKHANDRKALEGRTEYFDLENVGQALAAMHWATKFMDYVYKHRNNWDIRKRMLEHIRDSVSDRACRYSNITEINAFWSEKVDYLMTLEPVVNEGGGQDFVKPLRPVTTRFTLKSKAWLVARVAKAASAVKGWVRL